MSEGRTMRALPMILARKCVEAATRNNPQGWRGMSSGWAQDETRRIERRICDLFGKQPGRVSQGMVEVEIQTAADGTHRMIIDRETGYFDHAIAVSVESAA